MTLTAPTITRAPASAGSEPRVIGELLRCGCCCRVRCPYCHRAHYHGVGKDHRLLGWRAADCFGGGQYDLAGVVAGGAR